VILHGVPERPIPAHAIAVAPAHALPLQILLRFELLEDSLHGPFGDSDPGGDVADPRLGVLPDAEEDVGVVRQEVPVSHGFRTLPGGLAK